MVSSGSIRRLLVTLGALAWMLAASAGSALAADPQTCEVHVNPLAASGGSVFVFSGSGFKPTQLTLQKEDDGPINHDLNVGDADPWEVTVRSRAGDEGTWSASFNDPVIQCTAVAEFRVTLSSTDLVEDIAAAAAGTRPAPLALYLLVILFGFTGGALLGRRVHARARA
ncbi:MAG: hypothetical protein WD830_06485 [Chloroflexota bacterium]